MQHMHDTLLEMGPRWVRDGSSEMGPYSSQLYAVRRARIAAQDDGQRDGRDGVLGQDGPDAAHESAGI